MSSSIPEAADAAEDEAEGWKFKTWWLTSNLDQVVADNEAAYGLTNFVDSLLAHVYKLERVPDREQVARIRAAIARTAPIVPVRLPIPSAVAADGMAAADALARHLWADKDWMMLDSRARREIGARLKILRNASHSTALQREIAGRRWTAQGAGFDPFYASGGASSRVAKTIAAAFDLAAEGGPWTIGQAVNGLRALLNVAASPSATVIPRDAAIALARSIRFATFAIADAAAPSISADAVRSGMKAAARFAMLLARSPQDALADSADALAVERFDRVALLAAELDACFRRRKIEAQRVGLRRCIAFERAERRGYDESAVFH